MDSKTLERVILPLEDSFVRKFSEGGVWSNQDNEGHIF